MLMNKKGFTLIEVLVVVLIIGILAALAAPNILGRIEQSRITSDKAMAKTLENAVASYLVDQDAANNPSSPPAGTAFVEEIVNPTYMDKASEEWIKANIRGEATATELVINGKANDWTITYTVDGSSFTIVAEGPVEED